LSDPEGRQHISREKLAREAMELAGVRRDPFKIWVGDWQLQSPNTSFPWQIKVDAEDFELELNVDALTSPVLQGDGGAESKKQ